jgi:Transposase IS116/IS110/IS902 family
MRVEAIGPQTATALIASMGDPHVFKSGRSYAASPGITPRQYSSGGQERLGQITRQGDGYLRTLLVHGARAYLRVVDKKTDAKSAWARRLKERRHVNVVSVALAAKHARIAWAILAHGTEYRPMGPEVVAACERRQRRLRTIVFTIAGQLSCAIKLNARSVFHSIDLMGACSAATLWWSTDLRDPNRYFATNSRSTREVIAKSDRAAPEDFRRPCSHSCNVPVETPSSSANCCCERPVRVRVSVISVTSKRWRYPARPAVISRTDSSNRLT